VPSVTVRYSDLNLATADGVDTLYRRISNAASLVCPTSYTKDMDAAAKAKQCQVEAIARAVQKVNNPKLALVHATRISRG
jgi:UrcA family protein